MFSHFLGESRAFIYFNDSLSEHFSRINALFSSDSADSTDSSDSDNAEKVRAVVSFQNQVFAVRRRVTFGFDSLLYSSLLMIALSLAVIIRNRNTRNAELNRLRAVSETHARFSRDLHDGVAQDLAAIKICAERGDLPKISFYADRSLSETRYLIDSLHQKLDGDLATVIQNTLAAFEANCKIQSRLVVTAGRLSQLDSRYQVEIIHILQESLSNIARHANATEVNVRITDLSDGLGIVIQDNGRGFSEEQLNASAGKGGRGHWGVANIKKRVEGMGGTVQFINDGGCTVAIKIKNPVYR